MATTISVGDLKWASKAQCIGNTEIFFGVTREKTHIRRMREAAAIAICNQCSVMAECRQFARDNSELGVWGAETEDERYAAGFLLDPDVARRNRRKGR
jgi:WhiB family redox-sensing transcriptional regulator